MINNIEFIAAWASGVATTCVVIWFLTWDITSIPWLGFRWIFVTWAVIGFIVAVKDAEQSK